MTSIEQQKLSKIRQWLEDVLFDLLSEINKEQNQQEIEGHHSLGKLSPLELMYKIVEKATDEIDELI